MDPACLEIWAPIILIVIAVIRGLVGIIVKIKGRECIADINIGLILYNFYCIK